MRTVVDTNVVSTFLSKSGTPTKTFVYLDQNRFDLLVSPAIRAEYLSVLVRPSMSKLHEMTVDDVAEAIAGLLEDAIMVIPSVLLPGATSDPQDDMLIECAVEGGADVIVSGDKHLLELGSYEGIQIVSPTAFVTYLAMESPAE